MSSSVWMKGHSNYLGISRTRFPSPSFGSPPLPLSSAFAWPPFTDTNTLTNTFQHDMVYSPSSAVVRIWLPPPLSVIVIMCCTPSLPPHWGGTPTPSSGWHNMWTPNSLHPGNTLGNFWSFWPLRTVHNYLFRPNQTSEQWSYIAKLSGLKKSKAEWPYLPLLIGCPSHIGEFRTVVQRRVSKRIPLIQFSNFDKHF